MRNPTCGLEIVRNIRHRAAAGLWARAVLWACVAALSGLTGCAGRPTGGANTPLTVLRAESPVEVETVADWNDVEPAVAVALGRTELVKAGTTQRTPTRLEIVLRSSRDEPGLLTVSREDADAPDPVRMKLTCRVGRFGDPEQEREFLALVVERLGQLKGVDIAPVRR